MIYYSRFKAGNRYFLIAKTSKGICQLSFSSDKKKFMDDLRNRYRDKIQKSDSKLAKEIKQVQEYFNGKRKSFDVKVDIGGTDFQRETWKQISKVKFGETISYAKLAGKVSKNHAIRAAANACGKNPVPVIIPCHRVIAKDGSIGGFGGGIKLKREMLAIESVKLMP